MVACYAMGDVCCEKQNFFLNRLNFSFSFPALRPKLLKNFSSKALRKQPNQGPKWHFSQLRGRYLLSLAIGPSETAKITPFDKYVNKFCVFGGSERKKSLTLGVFEWLVFAPQIAQNVSRTWYIPHPYVC